HGRRAPVRRARSRNADLVASDVRRVRARRGRRRADRARSRGTRGAPSRVACGVSGMRILHVLDHSLPLHSGYSFRTAAILREQRALGWNTLHLTTPRHGPAPARQETVDGWTFHRTEASRGWISTVPAAGAYLAEMHPTARPLPALVLELYTHTAHARCAV